MASKQGSRFRLNPGAAAFVAEAKVSTAGEGETPVTPLAVVETPAPAAPAAVEVPPAAEPPQAPAEAPKEAPAPAPAAEHVHRRADDPVPVAKKPWEVASGDPTAVNFRPELSLHAKMEWVCENVPKMSRLRILREGAELLCNQLIEKYGKEASK